MDDIEQIPPFIPPRKWDRMSTSWNHIDIEIQDQISTRFHEIESSAETPGFSSACRSTTGLRTEGVAAVDVTGIGSPPFATHSECISLNTEDSSESCHEQRPVPSNDENRLTIHPNLTFCYKFDSLRDVRCGYSLGGNSLEPLTSEVRGNQTAKNALTAHSSDVQGTEVDLMTSTGDASSGVRFEHQHCDQSTLRACCLKQRKRTLHFWSQFCETLDRCWKRK